MPQIATVHGAAAQSAAATVPATGQHGAIAGQVEAPVRVALANGASQVTVLLNPAELGRIDVQVARDPGGGMTVTLTAERAETAERLAADQPALHAALDRAGVATDRVVTVQAAPAPVLAPVTATATATSTATDLAGGFAQNQGGAAGDPRTRQQPAPSAGSLGSETTTTGGQARPSARALGIDITA